MVVQLLKILLEVIWENVLVEGNALTNAIIQAFGKYRCKSNYKVSGVGWLLVSHVNVHQ